MFQPLQPSTPSDLNLNQINQMVAQLNQEQTVKTFKQAGNKNAIIQGKLPYSGGYGSLYYDTTGTARILIGIDPTGATVLAISKPGFDIVTILSS